MISGWTFVVCEWLMADQRNRNYLRRCYQWKPSNNQTNTQIAIQSIVNNHLNSLQWLQCWKKFVFYWFFQFVIYICSMLCQLTIVPLTKFTLLLNRICSKSKQCRRKFLPNRSSRRHRWFYAGKSCQPMFWPFWWCTR